MKSFNHFMTIPLAHRGLHNQQLDENSLGAFKAAIEHGYGIELDVHPLKDGGLVVVHDTNLKRVTGVDVNVETLSEEDLKKYPLLLSKEKIPTLKEVFDLVAGKFPILVELKVEGKFNPELPSRVLKLLENYPKTDNIAIQSFNPYAMKYLKEKDAPYPLGQLVSNKLDGQSKFVCWLFRTLNVLKISRAEFIAFDIKHLPSRPVKRYRRKGYPILTWTIDDEEKLLRARKYADNIIFETVNIDK